jgi:hypothetical protein
VAVPDAPVPDAPVPVAPVAGIASACLPRAYLSNLSKVVVGAAVRVVDLAHEPAEYPSQFGYERGVTHSYP